MLLFIIAYCAAAIFALWHPGWAAPYTTTTTTTTTTTSTATTTTNNSVY